MASELKLEVGKTYRAENGEKVGPVRDFYNGTFDVGDDGPQNTWVWTEDGIGIGNLSLIAEWTDAPTGPVRTVTHTTREIVEGGYGRILVWTDNHGRNLVRMAAGPCDAAELRAAIATLTEIADALEEQA